MPTYEYRGSSCGREIEGQQKMSDPDLKRCEACGKDTLERLISWTRGRSDTRKAPLKPNNPKEAFRGIPAVDRSRSKRLGAADAAADPAPDPASPPPRAAPPATADAAPPAAGDAETVDDD